MSYISAILFNKEHGILDEMADNYYDFAVYMGDNTVEPLPNSIGYSRTDTLIGLIHETVFDNGVAVSLHLEDDSTDYQNTTGKVAYAIVTVSGHSGQSGQRQYKIWSAPTTDSIASATLVFDSALRIDTSQFNNSGDFLTSFLVPIQDDHFIVIENTSGATSRDLRVAAAGPLRGLVIEQA